MKDSPIVPIPLFMVLNGDSLRLINLGMAFGCWLGIGHFLFQQFKLIGNRLRVFLLTNGLPVLIRDPLLRVVDCLLLDIVLTVCLLILEYHLRSTRQFWPYWTSFPPLIFTLSPSYPSSARRSSRPVGFPLIRNP